jgi:hypothetical protein
MQVPLQTNRPELIAARTAAIRQALLEQSHTITGPDFQRLEPGDLACLFGLYDRQFFGGWFERALEAANAPLTFRLSTTMTRAGGKTIGRRRQRHGPFSRFEIAIASRLLLLSFAGGHRPVAVCGLSCPDRLSALERIMEHEIIHLLELLAWGKSSCAARRFKDLASGIFGHSDTRHGLLTPDEHAVTRHQVGAGSLVKFVFQGRRLTGRINRIHHRATVLVEDAAGRRYSDGRRYQKFYVPLGMLTAGGSGEL